MTKAKKEEIIAQLSELAETTKKDWIEIAVDLAELKPQGLGDKMLRMHNYHYTKAIIDAWCRHRYYAPLTEATQKEFDVVLDYV